MTAILQDLSSIPYVQLQMRARAPLQECRRRVDSILLSVWQSSPFANWIVLSQADKS